MLDSPNSICPGAQSGFDALRSELPRSITLSTKSKESHARAEALFQKKEAMLREGQKARAEYEAKCEAEREKTVRLRALRLARDAALAANKRCSVEPAG